MIRRGRPISIQRVDITEGQDIRNTVKRQRRAADKAFALKIVKQLEQTAHRSGFLAPADQDRLQHYRRLLTG